MIDSKTKGIMVPVLIEDIEIELQLDTGCLLSLISKSLYEEKFSHILLQPTDVILSTYTGEKISPLGQIKVTVKCNNSCYYSMFCWLYHQALNDCWVEIGCIKYNCSGIGFLVKKKMLIQLSFQI